MKGNIDMIYNRTIHFSVSKSSGMTPLQGIMKGSDTCTVESPPI